jgi:tetratricopeptide (TPR) repeat protein
MPGDSAAPSIFLSYSSKHRDLTRALAEALEVQYGQGSVWWDHALESWGDYEVQIRNALNQARVVVVLWSQAAAASDWVKSEASRANRDHRLVNVRATDASWREVPSPYDQHHVTDVADVPGILRSIEAVWTGRMVRTAVPLHEIYYRHHGQRLIDPKRRALPLDLRDVSPSELLQAAHEVVSYVDLTGVEAQFLDWCTHPVRATAGRLIHGPGGVGKTRLMMNLAGRLRTQGWTAGFLDQPSDSFEATHKQRWQALEQLIDHGDDHGLLIVVDYSEARQNEVKALSRHLRQRAEGETRPVRLILLARSAGEWWTTLHDETSDIQRVFPRADPPSVVELPPVASRQQRRLLFDASLAAFGAVLAAQGVARPGGTPSEAHLTQIETRPGFSRPLAIQMAALVWLTSAGPEAGDTSVAGLLNLVLGLERDHWRKIIGDLNVERMRDLRRAVAQVTMVGGTPTSESAERLLMADTFYAGRRASRVDVDWVRRSLAQAYGTTDGRIVPLEPDLLAEHHVATAADDELVDGCLGWVENESPDLSEQRRRRVLTVLQRATQSEHGPVVTARAGALLDQLVGTHTARLARAIVAVTVNTPGALASAIDRKIAEINADALVAIDEVLPPMSLPLLEVSLKVAIRRVDLARHALATNADRAAASVQRATVALATRLARLSIRFSNVGRREEALAASQEAVAIYRRLTEAGRHAFLPDLARSLTNLARDLSSLRRREDALAAAQEAVVIQRQLVEVRPDTSLPELASSLNNMSGDLAYLGRHDDALAASQEAVAIRRRLVEAHPDVFLPELANSLNNMGNGLAHLGRREAALAASQEAVAIYRRLIEIRPDAFLPNLAGTLSNVALWLSDLGRNSEALTASQEAVAIRRVLVEMRPDAFLPDLASSLTNMSRDLAYLGRHDDALAASDVAVAIRRRLVDVQPDVFLPDLAGSLVSMGKHLSNLGRRQAACAASHEAVAIYRPLAEVHPDVFLPELAASLYNLSDDLSHLGSHDDALAANQEAVAIYRPLSELRPDVFLPRLANSLNSMGKDLAFVGRRDDALAASQEAAAIYRALIEREARPEALLPQLARSLNNIGIWLSDLGRGEDGWTASQEAVAICRRLVEVRPETSLPDLANSLNNLGNVLAHLGRHEDALPVSQEAVAIYRGLTEARGHVFLPEFAASLGNLSDALGELARYDEAAQAAHDALEKLAPLVERYPDAAGQLARHLARRVRDFSEASSKVPDAALLERIGWALGDASVSE